jgi:hypothetical protein
MESLKTVNFVWDANVFLMKTNAFMKNSCNCVQYSAQA